MTIRLVLALMLLGSFSAAFPCAGKVLCDFEELGPSREKWKCYGGKFGYQKHIVHKGKGAALWVTPSGFGHLHLRGLEPVFGRLSVVSLWVWSEGPMKTGLLLAVGQNLDNFGAVPLAIEKSGWNQFRIPLASMAVKGSVNWDFVALFSLVYTGTSSTTLVLDDITLEVPLPPSRSGPPPRAVNPNPKAEEFVIADFERKGDERSIYFERSGGEKVTAPRPVRSGRHAFSWDLKGNRPFIRYAAIPRSLIPFMVFKGSFYFEGTGRLSLHALFCTTDTDNFQEGIELEGGKWTDVMIYLDDMLDVGKPDWNRITGLVFTIQGQSKGKVYFDDLVLSKTDKEGGKDSGDKDKYVPPDGSEHRSAPAGRQEKRK